MSGLANNMPINTTLDPNDPQARNKKVDFTIKYKTELCRNFELGTCKYGDKCAFAHGVNEI